MKKDQKITLFCLALAAAVLLGLGAGYDLALNHAIYNPKNLFAILMEAFCFWPLYLPFALLGGVWTNLYGQDARRRTLGELMVVATFGGLIFLSLPNLAERGLTDGYSAPLGLLLTFVFTLTLIKQLGKCRKASLIKLEFSAKFGILFCITGNLFINPLKLLWSRMRYDDMAALGDFSAFSPWYRWGEVAGNTSFPSGHTAGACGILVLLLLPLLFRRCSGKGALLTALCYGYIALSGFSRLVIGRHYLSDTVAAALVMSAVFFGLCALPLFKKKLAQTMALAEQSEE